MLASHRVVDIVMLFSDSILPSPLSPAIWLVPLFPLLYANAIHDFEYYKYASRFPSRERKKLAHITRCAYGCARYTATVQEAYLLAAAKPRRRFATSAALFRHERGCRAAIRRRRRWRNNIMLRYFCAKQMTLRAPCRGVIPAASCAARAILAAPSRRTLWGERLGGLVSDRHIGVNDKASGLHHLDSW